MYFNDKVTVVTSGTKTSQIALSDPEGVVVTQQGVVKSCSEEDDQRKNPEPKSERAREREPQEVRGTTMDDEEKERRRREIEAEIMVPGSSNSDS